MSFLGRHRHIFLLGVLGWTLFGVFFALQSYVDAVYFGQQTSFKRTLIVWLICGYAWMLLTPLIIYLSEKFFITRGQFGRNLAIHFLAASLLSILQLSVFIFVRHWLLGNSARPFSFSTDFQRLFVGEFHINLLTYSIVVGIWHLRLINRRYLEREREAARLALTMSQLETQLANARLDALKMQLHPHFLFNTLNSISVLIRDDPEAANRMLVRLSELLRAALQRGSSQEVLLKEELEFLRTYLEIEQVRLQDRLRVIFKVDDETLDARVPNLILQPLVENAIRHGIAPLARAGKIVIAAQRKNGTIKLSVSDNGGGMSDPNGGPNGIGLTNTRERLEKLYGDRQQFEIASRPGEGVEVEITIPFQNGGN
ncbi:MAG TPA: histidine kinase [Pyrinomonadaceae bacterium]|nr:histidine kinase [Pyrinomonadaceae bacterium]